MDEKPDSPPPPDDSARLRRVLLYSVLGGLCPLIPLPFLDDVLTRYFQRRMVAALLHHGGFEPTDAHVRRLTPTKKRGLILGCLIGVVWYTIKKISRKILYFFAIKDCVDVTSRLMHEGWLLQHALERGAVPPGELTDDSLDRLQGATARTLEGVNTRPIEQLLRRVFEAQMALLTKAADSLGLLLEAEGASRRDPAAIERALEGDNVRRVGALERLIDGVVRALGAERSYLRQLEERFDDEWDRELASKAIPDGESGC